MILVVGSQKIGRHLDEALRRIEEPVFAYEDAQARARMNTGTFMGNVLIIRREWIDGTVIVILVRESVGV